MYIEKAKLQDDILCLLKWRPSIKISEAKLIRTINILLNGVLIFFIFLFIILFLVALFEQTWHPWGEAFKGDSQYIVMPLFCVDVAILLVYYCASFAYFNDKEIIAIFDLEKYIKPGKRKEK